MAKKGNRVNVGLECSACNKVNYITERNKVNTTEKLLLSKYCNSCRKRTEHKEIKKLH
ncbi:50S ribosomal protein L33 [Candidatus Roizmanbacteria bacterium RIFCSPHIGHO2_02_FULL_40_9]|uniref:Large ribosomal subunit protein bL33 n=2 Tax=Candidatus Roizmaniibacteriota TaxID=1752723 RepID=A0A1F7IKY3_9BACT|nr:MAG: 50S ribosomal protein L33 [Candidatus Roizmanbacteria bacterium RIFCSPHIGHO2_02_FULL_40_9]OGK44025.1 MAG: 50S ribosomal protein L33 [Candidatus Roizmanbacteria bacterium RIFCSPLOWO2_01_FULL_38_11]